MHKINILCSHFPICSGCSVSSDIANTKTVAEAQAFFKEMGIIDCKLYTGSSCGWRCRAKLAVRGTWEAPIIGLYETGSHGAVDIPHCQVHHPLINQAAALLRRWIQINGIAPYQEKTGKGTLRYVEMAVDRENQKVQLVLVLNQRQDEALASEEQKMAIQNLWKSHPKLWHSFWLNFNKRRDNIILGDLWLHLYGEEWLWDRFCGRQVCFHPASFAQANPEMFEKLLIKLKEKIPQGARVVEFYAGGGVIGLSVLEKCKSLYCNEIVPLAGRCFEQSRQSLPQELKNNVSFICGAAQDQINLIDSNFDVAIVDPPRKGIDGALLSRLCSKSSLKLLIYVSCGWKSFQRDCKTLLESQWKLVSAESFLFFPGSDHLEVLAVFMSEGKS